MDPILSELSTMTHAPWRALHSMAHNFIELYKAVVHVISLIELYKAVVHVVSLIELYKAVVHVISFISFMWFSFCMPSEE